MLVLLFVLAVPISLIEGWPLIKERNWKPLMILGVVLGAALLIGLMEMLGLPSPLDLLARSLRPVGEMFLRRP